MFLELKKEKKYIKEYFNSLKSRLLLGSLEVEGEYDDYSSKLFALKLFQQEAALEFAFENKKGINRPYDFVNYVRDIVKKLSSEEISDFRTINAIVVGSNVERTKPAMIINDLIYLIDNYSYQINEYKNRLESTKSYSTLPQTKEFFEIEAQFHIRFLHIHPFEDYNGRTARIMLTRNLCENNYAPCILTKSTKKQYCDYIEHNDYKKLAELFMTLSFEELNIMVELYDMINKQGEISSNHLTIDQKEAYKKFLRERI